MKWSFNTAEYRDKRHRGWSVPMAALWATAPDFFWPMVILVGILAGEAL